MTKNLPLPKWQNDSDYVLHSQRRNILPSLGAITRWLQGPDVSFRLQSLGTSQPPQAKISTPFSPSQGPLMFRAQQTQDDHVLILPREKMTQSQHQHRMSSGEACDGATSDLLAVKPLSATSSLLAASPGPSWK